jgi:hypothetical protein
MAKRGILNHPKILRMSHRLGISQPHAVGLMEVFWQWVAQHRPNGDLSELEPEVITGAICHPDDPERFWHTLVEVRWIDACEGGAFIVHDWNEHADDTIHVHLARKKQWFANGAAPKTVRLAKAEREVIDAYYQTHEPPRAFVRSIERTAPCPLPLAPCRVSDGLIEAGTPETLTLQDEAPPSQDEILNAPPGDEHEARSSQGVVVPLNQTVSQDDATRLPFVGDGTPEPELPPNLPPLGDGTRRLTGEESAAMTEGLRRMGRTMECLSEAYDVRRLFTVGCPVGVFLQVLDDLTNADGQLVVTKFGVTKPIKSLSYVVRCIETRQEQIAANSESANRDLNEQTTTHRPEQRPAASRSRTHPRTHRPGREGGEARRDGAGARDIERWAHAAQSRVADLGADDQGQPWHEDMP